MASADNKCVRITISHQNSRKCNVSACQCSESAQIREGPVSSRAWAAELRLSRCWLHPCFAPHNELLHGKQNPQNPQKQMSRVHTCHSYLPRLITCMLALLEYLAMMRGTIAVDVQCRAKDRDACLHQPEDCAKQRNTMKCKNQIYLLANQPPSFEF